MLSFFNANTQKYDYIWLLGDDSNSNPDFAGMIFDFFSGDLEIYSEFRPVPLRQVNASLCDSLGNILFYTNGISIRNANHEIMENGYGLNPGFFFDLYEEDGYVLTQGAIALLQPESDSIAFLFHMDVDVNEDFTDSYSNFIYYSLIDLSQNDGLGAVTEKNTILIDQHLDKGKLTAVKHANGRDWWIMARLFGVNEYPTLLLTPNGIENIRIQNSGMPVPSGSLGQAIFSPDGSKYVHVNLHGARGTPIDVSIFDFDRCTGQLYNPIQFSYVDSAACLGAAISPNSRFLYVSSWIKVYQYDLWAADIEASRITVAE
ncbi:MAG: hypothetical protein DA408_08820, partial [Bacteroidetes bacterium]